MYEYRKDHVQAYGFIHRCLVHSWLNLIENGAKKKGCSETCLSNIKDFIKYIWQYNTFLPRPKELKILIKQLNTHLKAAFWKIVEVICLLMKLTYSVRETFKSYFIDLKTRPLYFIFSRKGKIKRITALINRTQFGINYC